MAALRFLRQPGASVAPLAALVLACGALTGCNSILGIESASPEPVDAQVTDAPTTDGPLAEAAGDAGAMDAAPVDAAFVYTPNYAVSCDNYCTLLNEGCGPTPTLFNTEYKSPAVCSAICKVGWEPSPVVLDPGVPPAADDSLACRVWHANAALEGYPANDPHTHCPHAGPLGGELCDPGGLNYCVPFCRLDIAFCNGDNQQYAPGGTTADQMAACLAACEPNPDAGYAGYPYLIDPNGNTTDLVPSGNSVNCRMYHLENALDSTDPSTYAFHCTHTSAAGGGPGFCTGPVEGGI